MPDSRPSTAVPAGRPVRETASESSTLIMPHHANPSGHAFGGAIISLVDALAAIVATGHARGQVVTASVDRIDFRAPIFVGDVVRMSASVNMTGRSSMEVGVRIVAEDQKQGTRRHTNSCYLTFVAIDEAGRPTPVAPVIPETPDELRRHAAALARRQRRLEERQAEGRR